MRLSTSFAAALIATAAGLSACASADGVPPSSYANDLRTLEASCTARDGILVSSGATTGRPETDNFCKINGPATRLPR